MLFHLKSANIHIFTDLMQFDEVNRHGNSIWTDCIMDRILKKVEMGKFITTALKSILKLVKLKSLVAKLCKMWKLCKPVKIANFVCFCITHGKLIPTSRKRYQFSVRNTKVYKIRKLCRAIFFSFHNISRPYFAILLILECSSMLWL